MNTQVRIQKMLSYIYEHYKETITLEDIAKAADISRRFRKEYGYAPSKYMIMGK